MEIAVWNLLSMIASSLCQLWKAEAHANYVCGASLRSLWRQQDFSNEVC